KTTYNSRCSPVVTHLTTNLPLIGLTLGEQTGSRIFQWIWSYVLGASHKLAYRQPREWTGFVQITGWQPLPSSQQIIEQ
ncbi:hypothetical protein M419DRAFT_84204, partial [Trichoderma reesei RUT C-30]